MLSKYYTTEFFYYKMLMNFENGVNGTQKLSGHCRIQNLAMAFNNFTKDISSASLKVKHVHNICRIVIRSGCKLLPPPAGIWAISSIWVNMVNLRVFGE